MLSTLDSEEENVIFKRMLGALGVGGPSVDTVLSTRRVQPGGLLSGEVKLKGGDFDAEIEHITLGLVARVELEHDGGEIGGLDEFFRSEVSGPFTLRKGEERVLPFQLGLPYELPVSEVGGQPLKGMALGVRTELAIAKAVDKGDLDPFAVAPLPSQERVLQAFGQLGFAFKSADLEVGRIHGVQQQLPFYQEIEFYPSPQYAGTVNEVELTFVADAGRLVVVLEADKRAGRYGGGDAIGRFDLSHEQALQLDWASEIGRWLSGLSQYGFAAHGHEAHHHGHHGHHGPGLGTVAAAGAVGLVGGMMAAEAVEEIFEDDGGDW
ncbi:sporulation protein [Nonomuraea soli]|uniref:Sporulation-control protein n=1 Tax=Nonomuraea soli TaxID=1032476 RepID=A0A7W0HQN9_9ACTN|nr:sporulation protein [Nonomuraea soli]MBA2892012.1 sporulation-control protein [Nonomuraea soli]